jgi:hypothetical protein
MAVNKPSAHTKARTEVKVSGGVLLPTSRPDLYLLRVGAHPAKKAPADQAAGPLLRKVGRALAKPGVDRETVFGASPKRTAYAYSLDPTNPTRMVREDSAGNKTIGRMVNGAFRKISAAA